jgi:predicted DNA-binding transcriptional regulator AlpA
VTERRTAILDELATIAKREAELRAELAATYIQPEVEDRLLTIKEAATTLSLTTDWLYRNAKRFPFTVRLGNGHLRFSRNGVQDYLKKQRGKRS